MKELKIDFIPVLMVQDPDCREAIGDRERSQFVCDKLGLELEKIVLDFDRELLLMDEWLSDMLFDRHSGIRHYASIRELIKLYGTDIIIINGQSCDSILSFGPSEKNLRCFLRRIQLYLDNPVFLFITKLLFEKRLKKHYVVPLSKRLKLKAFLDEDSYIFLLNPQCTYNNYLDNILQSLPKEIKNFNAKRMYLKIFGFLQGPDNQVVINSARRYKAPFIFMPYTSPNFIYSTIKYKSNLYELISPKYLISKLLKEYDFPIYKQQKNRDPSIRPYSYYENIINIKYREMINKTNTTYHL
jgi:hypothetical protein